MKITINADSINTLTQNRGKIAVEIDSFTLWTELIEVINNRNGSLQIADAPGQVIVNADAPAEMVRAKPSHFPEWAGGLHTYRYDDGLKHLVVNFPHNNGWTTLCGLTDNLSPRRREQSQKGRFDCPDCDEILRDTCLPPPDSKVLVPSVAGFSGIRCSTTHITEDDNRLLYLLSHQYEEQGCAEWLHYTGEGYLLRLNAWYFPVLKLKRLGLSKTCRRLVVALMHYHHIGILHLDAAGDVLSGYEIFDW